MAEPSPNDLAREARLSRDLILADREGATAEDLRDCAFVLMKADYPEAADLLFDVAELAVGTASGDLVTDASRARGRTTWDIAIDELSDLIAIAEALPDVGPLGAEDLEAAATLSLDPPDRAWLSAVFGPTLKGVVRRRTEAGGLVEAALRHGPFEMASLEREPSRSATALAFNVARRILIERSALARPPFGDLGLFEGAERLSALGLGFCNVGALAPTWPEIAALIAEAWRKAPRRTTLESAIDRFTVLLSSGLTSRALRPLVDDLADDGRIRILAGILLGLQRRPADLVDKDLLRTIRDAFLDLDDLTLAVAAQRRLTVVSGHDRAEAGAQDELETSLRNQLAMKAYAGAAERPTRMVIRRTGYGSMAARRRRRFGQALKRRSDPPNPPV